MLLSFIRLKARKGKKMGKLGKSRNLMLKMGKVGDLKMLMKKLDF